MKKIIGSWKIIGVVDRFPRHGKCYKCQCKCGTIKEILASELEGGRTKKCKNCCKIILKKGSVFGCYTVIEYVGVSSKRQSSYRCRCACGKENIVSGTRLKNNCSFCRHCRGKKNVPVGDKFGEWTVLRFEDVYKYKTRWKVRCSCGQESIVNSGNLLSGKSTKCYKCKNKDLKKARGRCFSINIHGDDCKQDKQWDKTIPEKFWKKLKNGAKKRNILFAITKQDLISLFEAQGRRCPYTNILLFLGNKNWSASVDRIDNEQGYVLDNIQFVHKHINLMKNCFSHDYFLDMCKMVSKMKKKK